MKLHQLRYLAAVAQSGLNITAAAQKLHTSQPGVSKQIKLLEDELGFQIFTREGRKCLTITMVGFVQKMGFVIGKRRATQIDRDAPHFDLEERLRQGINRS